ncbi:hypothetical protein KY290_036479 [Solanum tuberosum]|uniref:DUF4283 domain-containing protein n=1 Tax=Solanum tuberosum TaxID=4113 RepID=A0ABQ7TU43_SOLTU|nr:hypothetical protein KY290_036479 [Solanum tuberosum]
MAGQITGDINSGEQIVEGEVGATGGHCSLDEELHLTNISTKLAQEHSRINTQTNFTKSAVHPQIGFEEHNCRVEEQQQQTFSHDQAWPNGQKQNHNTLGKQQMEMEVTQAVKRVPQGQKDQLDTTSDTNLEVNNVENSVQFSFGVKPVDNIPSNGGQPDYGMNPKFNNELSQVSMQVQQQTNIDPLSKKPSMEINQAGKSSSSNSCRNIINLSSSSNNHVIDNATGQKNIMGDEQETRRGNTDLYQQDNRHQNGVRDKNLAQPTEHGGNTEPSNYHSDFPKLSSNFDRHINSNQQNQQIHQSNQSKEPNTANENQKTKQDPSVEPAPYTVVQTLAARIRQIHTTQITPIELIPPKHTTKQGQPAVIYDMDDFMNKLAVDCKYTLIGKFSTTMPKIELIRKSFILQTQLNGGVNIAHYNARHVFIDLENELDYNTVWTQQRMTIEGKLMRIQAWTPNFKPEEETPIVPIWVLLPGLPWHCFKKEFITPLLESVGKVLYLDTASIKRTRASMAKVKVQVDLTKTRPRHVWIGLDEEDLTIGRWQPIEYENIPPYCAYCKHQGHMIGDCNFKIRDEDLKRRKELGAEMKNISNREQEQQGKEHRQVRPREQEEQQHQRKEHSATNCTAKGGRMASVKKKKQQITGGENTEACVETNLTKEQSVKRTATTHNSAKRYN